MLPPLTDTGPRECSSIIKKHTSLTYWAADWNMLCVDPSKSDIFSTEVSKIKWEIDFHACFWSMYYLVEHGRWGSVRSWGIFQCRYTIHVLLWLETVMCKAVIERWQYSNISTDGHTFGFHDESSHLNMSVKKRSLLPHVQPLFLPGLLISECRILNQHGSAQGYNETSDWTRRLTKHNI